MSDAADTAAGAGTEPGSGAERVGRPLDAEAFGPTPTLPGDVVTLVPLGPEHFEDYWAMVCEPESLRLTGTHGVPTIRDTRSWLDSRADHRDRADFAILTADTGTFVGEVVLNEFEADDAACSFRILLLGPAIYGRGYGTAATRMVLRYGFDTVGLHRISLEVFDFNPRAERVYEKCGFRREGRKRDALLDGGRWHDAIIMAILETDRRP